MAAKGFNSLDTNSKAGGGTEIRYAQLESQNYYYVQLPSWLPIDMILRVKYLELRY